MCQVASVQCQVSSAKCHVSCVMCHEVTRVKSQVCQVSNVSSGKGQVSRSVKFQVPRVKMCQVSRSVKGQESSLSSVKCVKLQGPSVKKCQGTCMEAWSSWVLACRNCMSSPDSVVLLE